jgi:hypothetical protein
VTMDAPAETIGAEQMEGQALDSLPDRWRRILQRYAAGEDFRAAAKAEGCSHEYSKVLKTRMLKNPEAVKFLESIRSEARTVAVYGVVEAMKEAKDDHDIAVEKGQMVAAVRATELRMRLSGLLIDKVQIEAPPNLRLALDAAEARVLTILKAPSQACVQLDQAADQPNGGAHWELTIPGSPAKVQAGADAERGSMR